VLPTEPPGDRPPTPTPESAETATTGSGTGDGRVPDGPLGDGFNIGVTPAVEVATRALNPVAGSSPGELLRERTDLFEQFCGCSIGDVSGVEYQLTSAPSETTVDSDAVGTTVYQLGDADEAGVRTTTAELVGERVPIRYFTVATTPDDGEGVEATLILAAKASHSPEGNGSDVVVASYVAERYWPDLSTPLPVLGENGLFTTAQLSDLSERFATLTADAGVSPEPTGSEPDTTADASTPTPAQTADWSSTVLERPPLDVVRFESDAGTVTLRLPDDLTAGDRATGTLSVEGSSDADLTDHEVAIDGTTTSVTADTATFDVPANTSSLGVELHHPERGRVAATTVDVHTRKHGYPAVPRYGVTADTMARNLPHATPSYSFPTIAGEYIPISGGFTGDASGTTVTVGGSEAPVVAETLRRTIVAPPDGVAGDVSAEVAVGNVTFSGEFRLAPVDISTGADTAEAGETVDYEVEVGGLDSLEEKTLPVAYLTVRSHDSEAATLACGSESTVPLHPGVVDSDGRATLSGTLTGQGSGDVSLGGELSYGPPRGSDTVFRVESSAAGGISGTLPEHPRLRSVDPRAFLQESGGQGDGGGSSSSSGSSGSSDSPTPPKWPGDVPSTSCTGHHSERKKKRIEEMKKRLRRKAKKEDKLDLVQDLLIAMGEINGEAKGTPIDGEKFDKAIQEAEELADCIIERIYHQKYEVGWDGGHDENWKVWKGGEDRNGICGQWAGAIMEAINNCRESAFDCWNFELKYVDGLVMGHQVIILVPPEGDTSDGVVIDPWRREGCPFWLEVDEDTEYDWASGK